MFQLAPVSPKYKYFKNVFKHISKYFENTFPRNKNFWTKANFENPKTLQDIA